MKKTLNINLSGLVFTIDEDAYSNLKSYLDTLRNHFRASEGSDEIMDDIEARVAELMQEKLSSSKTVINIQDIQDIIAQMGSPEDYVDESVFEETETNQQNNSSEKSTIKKLYRDGDNAILGGVCAGIAHYVGVQPLWIRLALLFAFLVWGFGFLIYIILWIIVPKARTTAEKLEMTGEPVNVSNIGKYVEDEISNVNQRLKKDGTVNSLGSSIASFIEGLGRLLVRLLTLLLKAIGKILGSLLLFIGSLMTISLIIAFIAMLSSSFISIGEFSGYSFAELSNLVFASSFSAYMTLIGGFLVSVIPVLAILYGGVSLVSGYKNIPAGLGWGLAGTWLLGIILLAYGGISTGNDYSKPGTIQESEVLDFKGDTLFLTLNEGVIKELEGSKIMSENEVDFHIDDQTGVVSISDISLDVEASPTNRFELVQRKTARGNTFSVAEKRAAGIIYDYSENENTLAFDPFLSFQQVDKWRKQNVELVLLIPVGKTVYLEANLDGFIYDIDNITNTYDAYMLGHYWTMTDRGLQSPDFSKNEELEENKTEKEVAEVKVSM